MRQVQKFLIYNAGLMRDVAVGVVLSTVLSFSIIHVSISVLSAGAVHVQPHLRYAYMVPYNKRTACYVGHMRWLR